MHSHLLSISFIIPVRDKASFIKECVGSVVDAALASSRTEVIIVDNGSTDGSLALCESFSQSRVSIFSATGTIAAVRNKGAKRASGDWLYFLDCDCSVPIDLPARLRRVASEVGLSVTGCAVDYPLDRSWIERTWNQLHRRRTDGDRSYINSGNFAIARSAFFSVEGFCEKLVTGEDAEIGARLRRAGYAVRERGELAVLHLDNATNLRTFYGKEVWRGLGARGTSDSKRLDRPTLFALLHVGAQLLAVSVFVAPLPFAGQLLLAPALSFCMPAAAVLGRWVLVRRGFNVPQAMILYWLYLAARAHALLRIATSHVPTSR